MSKAIVTIPAYKEDLSEFEKVSLVQCCKILNKHDFAIICPKNLKLDKYFDILNSFKIKYIIIHFENEFFESVEKYNLLMLSGEFYRRFNSYNFMLIYQLDAYVFQDDLNYWCDRNYDYIGAPWFGDFSLSDENSKMLDVAGNGGFSLRKIESFVKILEHKKEASEFIEKYVKDGQNEDLFFSKFARDIDEDFKVASPEEAMKFSFECQPRKLYEMNGKKLPFGCHAWERYGFDFWEPFINLGGVNFERENTLNLTKLSSLRGVLDMKNVEIKVLNNIILNNSETEECNENLNKVRAELAIIHNSREWRAVLMLQKIIKMIVPENSLRRNSIIILWKFSKGIIRKMRMMKSKSLVLKNIIFGFSPRKNRAINKDSRKIIYVGHSYHNKTKSTDFLLSYLEEFFEVEVISDDTWQGGAYPDLSFIDESYLGVIFFQLLPSREIIASIKNDNIIYFPMYDQVIGRGYDYWYAYRDLKIINFSKTLHKKLNRWWLDSMHVQYFPKPVEFLPGNKEEIFFWQRLMKININIITKLFVKSNPKIHIHKAVDPKQEFVQPKEETEKKFQITYSDWFETRGEMQEVIKQKGIYIAPREFEGIGMSFLEAMAMGKAVVAVNNPTMNEYIEHEKTGYLFDLKNPKEIDLSNIEEVQKNAYEYMQAGYKKWEAEKHNIIDFIKKQ
ncbi:MAG: Glycosyltransferase, group 1 family protein [Candidatus Moranbacteria bacterium GW2011_GWA2_39_41]|nr:MAG: Glycosyltransferase, group 1 family protein [Candidatus Moranbacteria bacterium GW2011_GWA2_39_41]